MSHYDRGGRVSPEDEAAWESQNEQILAILLSRPMTTNVELHRMGLSLDPSRRMYDLAYKRGYYIRSERIPGQRGVWGYSVHSDPDPEHEVDIRTIFPDHYVHFHTVIVNANNVAKAKNIAQHFHVQRKIMAVRRVPVATGAPRIPPIVNRAAYDMTRLFMENQQLRLENQEFRRVLPAIYKRWKIAMAQNEFDKTEWWDICRKLSPDLTWEDYELLWANFLVLREARARKNSQNGSKEAPD